MTTSPQLRVDVAGLVIALVLLGLAGLVWWDMTKSIVTRTADWLSDAQ
jgi:putative tricarboxylic transport membrane protein